MADEQPYASYGSGTTTYGNDFGDYDGKGAGAMHFLMALPPVLNSLFGSDGAGDDISKVIYSAKSLFKKANKKHQYS